MTQYLDGPVDKALRIVEGPMEVLGHKHQDIVFTSLGTGDSA